jgi:hypothetical protein
VFFSAPEHSLREVDDAQDDYWRGHFTVWLYLAAKTSHIGGGSMLIG